MSLVQTSKHGMPNASAEEPMVPVRNHFVPVREKVLTRIIHWR